MKNITQCVHARQGNRFCKRMRCNGRNSRFMGKCKSYAPKHELIIREVKENPDQAA